jgi:hypothetical protein
MSGDILLGVESIKLNTANPHRQRRYSSSSSRPSSILNQAMEGSAAGSSSSLIPSLESIANSGIASGSGEDKGGSSQKSEGISDATETSSAMLIDVCALQEGVVAKERGKKDHKDQKD